MNNIKITQPKKGSIKGYIEYPVYKKEVAELKKEIEGLEKERSENLTDYAQSMKRKNIIISELEQENKSLKEKIERINQIGIVIAKSFNQRRDEER